MSNPDHFNGSNTLLSKVEGDVAHCRRLIHQLDNVDCDGVFIRDTIARFRKDVSNMTSELATANSILLDNPTHSDALKAYMILDGIDRQYESYVYGMYLDIKRHLQDKTRGLGDRHE